MYLDDTIKKPCFPHKIYKNGSLPKETAVAVGTISVKTFGCL